MYEMHPQHYAQQHSAVSSIPMCIIMMNLIEKFKSSPQGHQYALTVIDMLMNCSWCIALYTEETDVVVHAYLVHIYSMFSWSQKILSNNSTEFKNKLLESVASPLGMNRCLVFPYYPSGNWCIENVHNFLKMWIWIHVFPKPVWDDVVHSLFQMNIPKAHSSLCLNEMHIPPLLQLQNPNIRYIITDKSPLTLELSEVFLHK